MVSLSLMTFETVVNTDLSMEPLSDVCSSPENLVSFAPVTWIVALVLLSTSLLPNPKVVVTGVGSKERPSKASNADILSLSTALNALGFDGGIDAVVASSVATGCPNVDEKLAKLDWSSCDCCDIG